MKRELGQKAKGLGCPSWSSGAPAGHVTSPTDTLAETPQSWLYHPPCAGRSYGHLGAVLKTLSSCAATDPKDKPEVLRA